MSVDTFIRPRLRGVVHQAFFPLFLAAGIVLVSVAGSTRGRLAMSSYAIGLAACLGMSTLYHRGRWTPPVRALLGRIDHSLIFPAGPPVADRVRVRAEPVGGHRVDAAGVCTAPAACGSLVG